MMKRETAQKLAKELVAQMTVRKKRHSFAFKPLLSRD